MVVSISGMERMEKEQLWEPGVSGVPSGAQMAGRRQMGRQAAIPRTPKLGAQGRLQGWEEKYECQYWMDDV